MKPFPILLLVFVTLIYHNLFSQQKIVNTREQVWVAYFNQTRLSNKWGFWLDIHQRQTDNFLDRPFVFIARPALNYYLKDNLRLQAGYAFINHFPAKGFSTSRPEHRVWQQVWWSQKYSGFSTLQWLRLEERYNRTVVNDVLQSGYRLSHRLRYTLSFFIPLKGKEMAPKTPFAAIVNELFINLGKKTVYNTFDQNRLFIGGGYQFNKSLTMQFGYMNIFQQEPSGNQYWSSHAIRLFLLQTLDLRNNNDHLN
jgi:hypothetical protein